MSSGTVHVLVRVWLPDRPGALGLVASRIGAVEGDIVGIDVLERGGGVAVDEFAVLLAESVSLDLLVREIEEVDGASVEEVRTIEHFPDPRLDALESAATLCAATTPGELHETLVEKMRADFLADWTALMVDTHVLASAGKVADPSMLAALVAGTSASPRVADGTTGPTTWRSPGCRATTRHCSSAGTAIRSAAASGRSSRRWPASPTAPGHSSRSSEAPAGGALSLRRWCRRTVGAGGGSDTRTRRRSSGRTPTRSSRPVSQ